ncbi:MAG: twin-arginine translocase TatA/TatE family subunit [Selenomonadaceae bacterium]|nr:twin-arginine translocase TatA/TatE family subunit [Selenomonadaceae bacterium]
MFHMGVPELVLILIIGLVIFGPGKLPGVGKALGQSIREFKKANTEDDEKDKNTVNVTAESKELTDKAQQNKQG